jgi:hypothetical protein
MASIGFSLNKYYFSVNLFRFQQLENYQRRSPQQKHPEQKHFRTGLGINLLVRHALSLGGAPIR